MAEAQGQAPAAPLNPIERIQNILLAEKQPEKAPLVKAEQAPEQPQEEAHLDHRILRLQHTSHAGQRIGVRRLDDDTELQALP